MCILHYKKKTVRRSSPSLDQLDQHGAVIRERRALAILVVQPSFWKEKHSSEDVVAQQVTNGPADRVNFCHRSPNSQ